MHENTMRRRRRTRTILLMSLNSFQSSSSACVEQRRETAVRRSGSHVEAVRHRDDAIFPKFKFVFGADSDVVVPEERLELRPAGDRQI